MNKEDVRMKKKKPENVTDAVDLLSEAADLLLFLPFRFLHKLFD